MSKSLNRNLHKAKAEKNDEFYTQLSDIEDEMKYYRDEFKDKVVLCNCDDPRVSQFFNYFFLNFKFLGLKKLIATCYKNQEWNLFSEGSSEKAVYIVYDGPQKGDDSPMPKDEDIKVRELHGDGDFRSPECKAFLEMADIVVTNPPFSLFREFIATMLEYDKKFLILGNMNATTYKEIFPLFRNNKLWYGVSISSGDRKFYVPDDYELNAANCGIDKNGKKFIRIKGVRWFTNLKYHKNSKEPVVLVKKYKPELYPKYDNYDAINVDKVVDIPNDYFGVIGVPITFLDKWNPNAKPNEMGEGIVTTNDFEIVSFRKGEDGKDLVYRELSGGGGRQRTVQPYFRILIRRLSVTD